MDPMGRALLGTESVPVVRGRDRLEVAVEVVDSVCARHGADRDRAGDVGRAIEILAARIDQVERAFL